MSTAVPAAPAAPGPTAGASPPTRKPRKIFLLVGTLLAVGLGIGLFTSAGSGTGSSAQPGPGDPVPSFSAPNIGANGPKEVSVSEAPGTPTVLLFFGAWCSACQSELPPLVATVRRQDREHGRLSHVRVIGVDTLDDPESTGIPFVQREGMTFPVASDPDGSITQGTFHFNGDPYTVFVKGDGTIDKVVAGAQLTASSFTADERALIPSGT